ncbi:MAG: two component transcriptional regulator, LuxR family [Chitinophagaceae bacterium]|nr:two component transcriptional regulator, LuxR family [Chitinophagaceae bacterium]
MEKGKAKKSISVLVVDDHPLYRQGIKRLLNKIPLVDKCEEAENGQQAIQALEAFPYDIVLLDVQMPVMDGLEAAAIIRNRFPDSKIIVLTMSDSKRQIIEMLDLGVVGYVLKSTDGAELTDAITLVKDGDHYLSKEVKEVWNQYLSNKHQFNRTVPNKIDLTAREVEIIIMICKQMNTLEIAEKLSLSQTTVNTHRYHIMKKLNTDNVVGIALYAVKAGLFVP